MWTKHIVEERLVEAQRVINATVRIYTARGRSHDIPPAVRYFGEADIMEFERLRYAYFKQEGYFDEAGRQIKALPWIWPLETAQPADAIDRATEAMSWPVVHVPDAGRRVAVLCWMVQRAHRGRKHGFIEMVNQRRQLLFLERIEKWQAHRDKGYALDQIAEALNAGRSTVEGASRAA